MKATYLCLILLALTVVGSAKKSKQNNNVGAIINEYLVRASPGIKGDTATAKIVSTAQGVHVAFGKRLTQASFSSVTVKFLGGGSWTCIGFLETTEDVTTLPLDNGIYGRSKVICSDNTKYNIQGDGSAVTPGTTWNITFDKERKVVNFKRVDGSGEYNATFNDPQNTYLVINIAHTDGIQFVGGQSIVRRKGIVVRAPVDQRFTLINRNSGKAVTITGTQLTQTTLTGLNNQQFLFRSFKGGYSIRNAFTDVLLDTAANDGVVLAKPLGTTSQIWEFLYVEDDSFAIRNKQNGRVIGVKDGNKNDGAVLEQQEQTLEDNQLFRFLTYSLYRYP